VLDFGLFRSTTTANVHLAFNQSLEFQTHDVSFQGPFSF